MHTPMKVCETTTNSVQAPRSHYLVQIPTDQKFRPKWYLFSRMNRFLWDAIFLLTGTLFTCGQVQENSTTAPVKHPLAAAVRSHFDDCPDSHRHFCFHGTCRFLVQEDTPACVCHAGFVGMRCEHADLLAVVATNQKQQTVATMLVLCVIGCVMFMLLCTVVHCWHRRGLCELGPSVIPCPAEKPSNLLKGGASYCQSETVV